jgi:CHAD domain-containing protein
MSPRGPDTIRAGLALAAERPLAQLAHNLPKTLGAEAYDAIHDARVALRRLGALLRAFAPVLPAASVAEVKREIRWLRRRLGPARDLDVFIHETGPALSALFGVEPGLATMLEIARDERAPLRDTLARTVDGARVKRFLATLRRVFGPEAAPRRAPARRAAARPTLDSPLAPYVYAELRRRYKKLRKTANRIERLGEDELHRLRIRLRNFRYVCDAFRDLLPARRYAELRAAMTKMQDHMGGLNDAANAPHLAARLVAAAGPQHDAAALARAAGVVAGWGAARRHLLRATLEEPWHRMIKRADRMFAAVKK